MVIQPPTSSMNAENGLTNSVPDCSRKRSRDHAWENQFNNINVVLYNPNYIPLQGFAAQIFANNLKSLLETDLILSKNSKKIKMEIAARKKEAPKILFDGVEAPLMKKLKENEEEILDMRRLNIALQERVKCLSAENQLLKDVGNIFKGMTLFRNVNNTQANASNQGLPHSGAMVADRRNNSGENKQRGGQTNKLVATAGDKGDSGKGKKLAGQTKVSSGCRMCKKCGERESCIMVFLCEHLCLCNVCADAIANLQATCPVCNSPILGMVRLA